MKPVLHKRAIYTDEQRELIAAMRAMRYIHFWVDEGRLDFPVFMELYKMGKLIKRWNADENKEEFILLKNSWASDLQ